MGDEENRAAVQRKWQACSHPGDLAGLDEVFHDDAIVDWPQSGERVVGKANILEIHRNSPGLPTITPRRIIGQGELWFTEQIGDYGGRIYCGSSVFEVRDGKIARETDYFGEPFDAPAWRAPWVELEKPPS